MKPKSTLKGIVQWVKQLKCILEQVKQKGMERIAKKSFMVPYARWKSYIEKNIRINNIKSPKLLTLHFFFQILQMN
jgi:hypothetical protein